VTIYSQKKTFSFKLRPARKADYDFLFHLIEVCMKEYVEATWGWHDDFQQDYFAKNFDVSGCQIVLVDGQEAGQITTIDQGNNIFISAIYLLPEYQGLGIGSTLIQDIFHSAEQANSTVSLRVLTANKPARRLYERLGFVETADNITHRLMKWHPPTGNQTR
jgi:ribosomal protein S18 acetylase RimI-like enzyme